MPACGGGRAVGGLVIVALVVLALLGAGAIGVLVGRFATMRSINKAIGGRPGLDPRAEHRRLLDQAQAGVQASQTRCEMVVRSLDALTAGVVIVNAANEVLACNEFARQTSLRAHERTLVDAATRDMLAQALNGERSEREIEAFGPPPRILFTHALPIVAGDDVVGALAVIDDVTDHHRIEATRRDFVANLSHELRTPVGAASLLAQMISDEPDADTRRDLTRRMVAETDRMSATVEDLLTLSRLESSTQDYSDHIVVQNLVAEALDRNQVAAAARGVSIGTVARDEPIEIVGNRDQLMSALVNLIDNAIKYSEAGDSVSVRARVEDDELFLVVQDTGRGIPGRDLDRIFERFYRVDRSRDTTTGGTGIGLSIVRHVAVNHGGAVSAESMEGDGSTFTIALPVVRPAGERGGRSVAETGRS